MLRHFSRGSSGDDFMRSENICQAHDVPPDDIGRSGACQCNARPTLRGPSLPESSKTEAKLF
jgi:hypothetical protein